MQVDAIKHRAKVYELTNENQWDDKGTGSCSCEYVEAQDDVCITVHSETDDSVVLNARIVKGDIYQKQQDTLIVWTEPSDGTDLALSFEKVDGCAEIWEQICEVQRRLQHPIHDDMLSDSPGPHMPIEMSASLPTPSMGNLEEIESYLQMASQTDAGRDKVATFIQNNDYIAKCVNLFTMCEDLDADAELYRLCNIMKGIVLLNDSLIVDTIVRDDLILGVVGMLEHDPGYPNATFNYRQYLSDKSRFKEVVPIKDDKLRTKIHETFRLQYLKDVVLARILDDPTFGVLNSRIFFNHVDIINLLNGDTEFLQALFDELKNEEASVEKKRDVVLFVHQFCTIAKNLQQINRVGLYRTLSKHGLFRIFDFAFFDPLAKIRMAGAEVLAAVLEHDAGLVRSYMMVQVTMEVQPPLLEVIISRLLNDEDAGVSTQLVEVLKLLLDTAAASGGLDGVGDAKPPQRNDEEAAQFLEAFYNIYMANLCAPILDLDGDEEMCKVGKSRTLIMTSANGRMCLSLCDILCFAVKYHSFRAKQFILSSTISQKVTLLLRAREKHTRLSAIRFFRNIIAVKDEFYNRHLIKNNLFAPLVNAFIETDNKDNLVNSALIEMLDFIRKENIKSLVEHIWRNFGEHFRDLNYVDTFREFGKRYDQNQDAKSNANGNGTGIAPTRTAKNGQNGWSSSTVDEDEEKYFNASDDEDNDMNSGNHVNRSETPSARKSLVDYPDDDDDGTAHHLIKSAPVFVLSSDTNEQGRGDAPDPSNRPPTPFSESFPTTFADAAGGHDSTTSPSDSDISDSPQTTTNNIFTEDALHLKCLRKLDDGEEDNLMAARERRNRKRLSTPFSRRSSLSLGSAFRNTGATITLPRLSSKRHSPLDCKPTSENTSPIPSRRLHQPQQQQQQQQQTQSPPSHNDADPISVDNDSAM